MVIAETGHDLSLPNLIKPLQNFLCIRLLKL